MYPVKRNISNKKQVAKLIENWVVPEPNVFSEYSQLAEYLDNLNQIAVAIEDGVDWLFEDYLETKT